MSPIGRRGGTANDADALDACGCGALRGGDDTGRTIEPGAGVAIDTGDTGCGTPCCADGTAPRCAEGGGIATGGIDGGAYDTGPDGIAAGAACCG